MESPSATPAAASSQIGLFELFIAFAKMSLAGFGGVLFWARRAIVEQHKWMTPTEFNEAFALCHLLPGPNIVNLAVVFGSRFRGAAGSVAAFLGLLGPPVVIITALGALYYRYGDVDSLRRTLHGISCAAIGLFLATVVRMILPLIRQRAYHAAPVIAAVFVAIGLVRWPLPYVLLAALPFSLALAWLALGREAA